MRPFAELLRLWKRPTQDRVLDPFIPKRLPSLGTNHYRGNKSLRTSVMRVGPRSFQLRRARGINLHRARSCIVLAAQLRSAERYFPTIEMEIHMKRLIPTLAMLMLSAASLTTNAKVTEADMLGNAAQPSAAQRTIVIDNKTQWITVEHDDVVRFLSNAQEFAWAFKGMSSSFALNKIAPAGALDRDLKVYVWPNARDLADN